METALEEGHRDLLRQPEQRDRCNGRRVLTILFSILHCCTVLSMLLAILNFLIFKNYLMMSLMTLPLFFSGFIYGHITESSKLVHLPCSKCAALLESQTWYWKAFRWIVFGLLQGVVVLLAWDDFLKESNRKSEPPDQARDPLNTGDSNAGTKPLRKDWNRFHCKAVGALCEGLPAMTMMTYAWCSLDSKGDPWQFSDKWLLTEKWILRILGFILFASAAFGIVELDFCCSSTLAKKMRESVCNRIIHLLFRMSEVLTRTVMHVMFVVATSTVSSVWWIPATSNFVLSFVLLFWYGGDEKHCPVRFLCSLPCTWVNIFFFVDSPYKRKAARRISSRLEARFVAEIVFLPLWVCSVVAWRDVEQQIRDHHIMFGSMVICVLLHVILRLWMERQVLRQMNRIDIFTASERGKLPQVKEAEEAMKQLVAEVRGVTLSPSVEINLNKPDVDGNTVLMLAAKHGHTEVCKFLVEKGASTAIKQKGQKTNSWRNWWRAATWHDWTALHIAARRNHHEVIEALSSFVRQELRKDRRAFLDSKGQTPLHVAVAANHFDATRVLVETWPAWIQVQDASGKTPEAIANSERLRRYLLHATERSASSVPNSPRAGGGLPFMDMVDGCSDWLGEPLRIHMPLEALGLSSYVAASCGGALGRLCLTEVEDSVCWPQNLEYVNAELQSCASPDDARLGEGRVACVYRVRHSSPSPPKSLVAMKVVKGFQEKTLGGAPPEVSRECEVGAYLQQMPHPCIVRLFSIVFDVTSGLPVLFMEYCPSTLETEVVGANRRCRGGVYQPHPRSLDWLGQIFLGLEHMHQRLDILFRDLKLANVLIGSNGCAKLADFGAGRFGVSGGAFSFGHAPGTVGYTAPEVLSRRGHNFKADIYSFGVVAWLVFTGGIRGATGTIPVSSEERLSAHVSDVWRLYCCVQGKHPPFQTIAGTDLDQAEEARRFTASLLGVSIDSDAHWFRDPDERMRHDQIRSHPLLAPLGLPRFTAGPQEVDRWLQSRREILERDMEAPGARASA